MNAYEMIFKRKSFHIFRNTRPIPSDEMAALRAFIDQLRPLDPALRTRIDIVPEHETSSRRGAEYCILIYSQPGANALRNAGYIGEQIDLYCASRNIGALWLGLGRPAQAERDGLRHVIMIAIAAVPPESFRKDMFKAKRKPVEDIWLGDTLGIAEIVRFAPSACNSQPWRVENRDGALIVSRIRKPGKIGILPAGKVCYYNRIDCGIFLYLLEVCLDHAGIAYTARQFVEEDEAAECALVARYELQ